MIDIGTETALLECWELGSLKKLVKTTTYMVQVVLEPWTTNSQSDA